MQHASCASHGLNHVGLLRAPQVHFWPTAPSHTHSGSWAAEDVRSHPGRKLKIPLCYLKVLKIVVITHYTNINTYIIHTTKIITNIIYVCMITGIP